MYSHYMEGTFSPFSPMNQNQELPRNKDRSPEHPSHMQKGKPLDGLTQLLGGALKQFSLRDFDTGDILLVLIVLFLFLEGDNLELVITLGLMLFFGLNDQSAS